MYHKLTMVGVVGLFAALLVPSVATAQANDGTLTYKYTDCTGAFTGDFDAYKQGTSGAAVYRLVDGTANFALVAYQVTGPDAGDLNVTKNGIDKNGRETATCSLLSPKDGVTRFVVTGFFTPAG